jgi:PAS domain S-box-containing protein
MPSASPLPLEIFRLVAQNAGEGVVIVDADSRLVFVNPALAAIFGYEPGDLIGQSLTILMPEEFRNAHARGMAEYLRTGSRHLNWTSIELPGLHRNGRQVPLEISFAEARQGTEVFFAGFLRDLSEWHWTHARLEAHYAVSEILSTTDEETRALERILDAVGGRLGFAAGNLWLVRDDQLQWHSTWHSLLTTTDEFESASRQRQLGGGEGLPGRAWVSNAPAWIASLQEDTNFPRAEAAKAAHLHSGFAFPIRCNSHVVGVMEYFSTHVRPLEPTLLQISNAIGQQISQFLERQHAQNALHTTETQHRLIFQNANDALAVSVEEHFVYVNQAYANMFGYGHPDELIGVQIYDTIPTERHALVREHRKRRLAGLPEPMQYEASGKRYNGTEFPTEVRATDYWIDGKMFTLAILRDTTREREARDALMHSNAALRRANEDLEQFAYAASHDLQEPLRMICIYSELLERRHHHAMSADARHLLATITDGAQRINELVKDLLSYTNAASMDPVTAPATDPNDVLVEVRKALQDLINRTNATVTSDIMLSVKVHRTHLVQILQNLVSNSLKYHSPDRPPLIHVTSVPAPGGMTELQVTDNGIGIEPEYYERVFGVFKRLHSRRVPGTGIGLAICKKIVNYYGGVIRVESTPGSGSTFHFTLPSGPE